jgi:hypothetical protein
MFYVCNYIKWLQRSSSEFKDHISYRIHAIKQVWMVDFWLGSVLQHRYVYFTFFIVRCCFRLCFGFLLGKLSLANWKWQFLLPFFVTLCSNIGTGCKDPCLGNTPRSKEWVIYQPIWKYRVRRNIHFVINLYMYSFALQPIRLHVNSTQIS